MACEISADTCSEQLNEAELQRACAPLYGAIAVDALANLIMVVFFTYVALIMHTDGAIQTPVTALGRLFAKFARDYLREVFRALGTIPQMHKYPLAARLRCCAIIDKAVSIESAIVPALAVTRWLNIGNVNGFRWLGYAMTCPFMQLELVVLIAPLVPCYRANFLFAFFITFASLALGWAVSVMQGDLYNGSVADFLRTWDIDELDPARRGHVVFPALCGISLLSFVQLPLLGVAYTIGRCTSRRDDLPEGYRRLLVSVVLTWWLFPTWWLISWEGAAYFKDAKLNEMGFTILNMVAKGSFIIQTRRMDEKFKASFPDEVEALTTSRVIPDVLRKSYTLRRQNSSQLISTLKVYDTNGATTEASKASIGERSEDLRQLVAIGDTLFLGIKQPTVSGRNVVPDQASHDDPIKKINDTLQALQLEVDGMKRNIPSSESQSQLADTTTGGGLEVGTSQGKAKKNGRSVYIEATPDIYSADSGKTTLAILPVEQATPRGNHATAPLPTAQDEDIKFMTV